MMRISERNALRKLRYAKAILLGCKFERVENFPMCWQTLSWVGVLPDGRRLAQCATRYEAVDMLLWQLDVFK